MANTNLLKALNEIADGLTFRAGDGCTAEGGWGRLRIAPTAPDRDNRCRLDIRVALQGLPADMSEAAVADLEADLDELLEDPRAQTRESAAVFATGVRGPRVTPGDLEGFRFQLKRMHEETVTFLMNAGAVSNRYGCCQIPRVHADWLLAVSISEAAFSAKADEPKPIEEIWSWFAKGGKPARADRGKTTGMPGFAEPYPMTGKTMRVDPMAGVMLPGDSMAAADAASAASQARMLRMKTMYDSTDFMAVLEESADGGAVLLIQTEIAANAKLPIAFRVGDEEGRLQFSPLTQDGPWYVRHHLKRPYEDVEGADGEFHTVKG